jgi:hypothetical protein
MGQGKRAKGAFPYATLRYLGTRPPCFGDPARCPDTLLCNQCVHHDECWAKV